MPLSRMPPSSRLDDLADEADAMRPSRSCSGGMLSSPSIDGGARTSRTSFGVDLAVADADEELVDVADA